MPKAKAKKPAQASVPGPIAKPQASEAYLMVKESEPAFTAGISAVAVVNELEAEYSLSARDLADVLDITPKTFSRWKDREDAMSVQQADRIMIVLSILELGKSVLGSEGAVKKWIHEPVFSLDGKAPLDLIKTESGRRKVETALLQIRHGFC
jgi:putative toxin-antitoxin system antitoxin component (TIGR02293 family)